jgi:hypothetical protein
MSTCNWLDLQTPGSQPIMPKNLPKHRLRSRVSVVVIARRAFNRELDSDSMVVL